MEGTRRSQHTTNMAESEINTSSEIEEWTTCYSCDQYEISTLGNIRLKSNGVMRKLQFRHGYWHVNLSHNGKTISVTVGKEVLSSFVRPRGDDIEYACHINGNTKDNRLSNLKWTNEIRNVKSEKTLGTPVRVTYPNGMINDYVSPLEAAEALGVDRSQIYDFIRGKRVSSLDDHEIVYVRDAPGIDADVKKILMGSNKIYVSSDGFVRDASSSNWRRGTVQQGQDYKRVTFQFDMNGERHIGKSGKEISHSQYVHKLVALAFLGPRPENWVIDHIDEDKMNNHYTNLQYVTRSEHSIGISEGPNKKVVYKYTTSGEYTGESFESASAAAREFGQQAGGISSCCNGKRISWKDFEWSYSPPEEYNSCRESMQKKARENNKRLVAKRRERLGPVKSTGKSVYAYNKDTKEFVGEWSSGKDAAEATGANTANISNCISGKLGHTKGLVFSRSPLDESVKKAKTS